MPTSSSITLEAPSGLGLSDSGGSVPHSLDSELRRNPKRIGALYDRSCYHVQEPQDPHIGRPQSPVQLMGGHLNQQVNFV